GGLKLPSLACSWWTVSKNRRGRARAADSSEASRARELTCRTPSTRVRDAAPAAVDFRLRLCLQLSPLPLPLRWDSRASSSGDSETICSLWGDMDDHRQAPAAFHLHVVVRGVMGHVAMDEPLPRLAGRPDHVIALTRSNVDRVLFILRGLGQGA